MCYITYETLVNRPLDEKLMLIITVQVNRASVAPLNSTFAARIPLADPS